MDDLDQLLVESSHSGQKLFVVCTWNITFKSFQNLFIAGRVTVSKE